MRVLVSMGVMSVIIALAPITLSRYGVTGHQLWAPCGVLVLVSWVVAVVAMLQTPEYREAWAKEIEADRTKPAGPGLIVGSAVYIGYVLASLLTAAVHVMSPTVRKRTVRRAMRSPGSSRMRSSSTMMSAPSRSTTGRGAA